jgi:hypothetical protein
MAEKREMHEQLIGQRFVVSQMPADALPRALQLKGQLTRRSSVQTMIEPTADSVRLVLYLDSLVAERDLRDATVQQVSNDSVIVSLGRRQYGYRLPSGWNQQSAETRK